MTTRPAIFGGIDWTGPRAITLIGLGLTVGAAWIGLMALHGEAAFALDTLAQLCLAVGPAAGLAVYPAVLAMWLMMAVAMMLPTAMPAIDLYVRLSRRMASGRAVRIALFVAGYVVAWGGFGAAAAAAQVALGTLPAGWLAPALGAGALLILAGAYQLSALKQACLDLCRNPLLFFMAHWRESLAGTFSLGLRHGAVCIGCCWALMLLMFLGGAMNLVWMALLGLVMLAEKALPGAGRWSRPAGGLLIAAGAATIATHLI